MLKALKTRAATTHAVYYAKLLEAADEFAAAKMPRTFGASDDYRGYGDALPVLALTHLLTGSDKYLGVVRQVISRLDALEHWGDDADLVAGHFLAGSAIAYDWLYDAFSASERKALAGKIARHAEIIHAYSSAERVWWHDYFLHNWCHVITGSLAYAGAALFGEHPAAADWISQADRVFTKVEEALPDDGSYQEGLAYMTYAWECILRYFDLAKSLFGRDHFGAKWLREAPYGILYFTTPQPKSHDNCMLFGDGPRHFEWHGPVHLLFRTAAEYRDAVVQGFARKLAEAGIGLTRTGTWLNMLWYDPSVPSKGREHLPTFKHFDNLSLVSARSSWDADAVMVGFKCTNNAGRKTMREYPGRDLGSGHAHPDAASFQIYAFGEWLAVDTGYTHFKESADHNTMLVNDTQQLGGERTWFDMMECLSAGATCDVTRVETNDRFDYARADATKIYRPEARLKKFVRHIVFLKPADVLVVDELAGAVKSKFEWRLHADDEIVGMGGEFHVRKNGARLRVAFLAPDGLKCRIRRNKIKDPAPSGLKETVLLSAAPERRVKETVFVTFMSAYRGDAPFTQVTMGGVSEGRVYLDVRREGRTEPVMLDLAEGKVTVG